MCLRSSLFLSKLQCSLCCLVFGVMSAVSSLDDPSALPVFLSSISAPDSVASALKAAGFNSLGTLTFALSDPSDSEQVTSFIRSILISCRMVARLPLFRQ